MQHLSYFPLRTCLFLQLSLTVGDKVYSFLTGDETGSQEVDAMVLALATAIRNIFPTVPLQ
jgi:predicted Zn-dependent protease